MSRVALVTGGARGIGRAIVERFAREGMTVCAFDRDGDALAEHAEALRGEGLAVEARTGDVSRPEEVEAWVEDCAGRHGRLDVTVANAAIVHVGTAEQTSVEEWDRLLAINLRGYFLLAKHALPHLRRNGGGSIINVASINGFWVEPQLTAYITGKGGVIAMTRSIAIDHGRENIRCNCICPGYIDTGLTQEYFDASDDPDAARREAAAMHPIGRLGQAHEVAAMASFLASDDASFCTGQAFIVDGGLSAGVPGT